MIEFSLCMPGPVAYSICMIPLNPKILNRKNVIHESTDSKPYKYFLAYYLITSMACQKFLSMPLPVSYNKHHMTLDQTILLTTAKKICRQ